MEALNARIVEKSRVYPFTYWDTLREARDLPSECREKLLQIDEAYQVVLDAGDPDKEVRRLYKQHALQYHPDKEGGDRHIFEFATALKNAYIHEQHGEEIRKDVLELRRLRKKSECDEERAREEANALEAEMARDRADRQAHEERKARKAAQEAAERDEALTSTMNSFKPAKSVHWTWKEQKQLISAIAKHGWPNNYDAFNPAIDQWEKNPRLGDDNDSPWSRIKDVMPEKFAKGDTCRNRYSRMIRDFCEHATGDPSDSFTLQIFCTLAREKYEFNNAYLKYKVMSCTRHIDSKKINVKWQNPSYVDDVEYEEHKQAVAAFERCSWNNDYLKVYWKSTEEDLSEMWKGERIGQWYGFKQAYKNMMTLEGASQPEEEEYTEEVRKAAQQEEEERKAAQQEEARKAAQQEEARKAAKKEKKKAAKAAALAVAAEKAKAEKAAREEAARKAKEAEVEAARKAKEAEAARKAKEAEAARKAREEAEARQQQESKSNARSKELSRISDFNLPGILEEGKTTSHRTARNEDDESDSNSQPPTDSLILYGDDRVKSRMGLGKRPRLLVKNASADINNLSSKKIKKNCYWMDGHLQGRAFTFKQSVDTVFGCDMNVFIVLCTNEEGPEEYINRVRVQNANGEKMGGNGFAHLLR
jgi:membrane protein involved in colicin uptake